MEYRQLVVGQKPGATLPSPPPLVPQDADLYIHPHLTQDYDQGKGRSLRVLEPMSAGTVLVADPPYAVVPAENSSTYHRTHDFEYAWIKQHGKTIRKKEGEYALSMLWIIVRMHAGRHLEIQGESGQIPVGWKAMEDLRDNRDLWPQEQLDTWRRQIETYFIDHWGLPDTEEVLMLICKEEANTFGLYPGATGIIQSTDKPHKRGPQYALGCYPRASMVNHSCFPNITWAADERGRLVFTTSRDIAAGEECCIAYFDLQRQTKDLFTFACTCERCLREGWNA
ncbi:SET domain-containing protein [Aspergillus ruber CBS 135680]|uniref:SET domain-containing protein n=1 Tax=Aspergillus ruber (strain CBS 135680) TaxID=1388766 RepID=A0A017SF63_ASPRC|nr:SET domain-containing protein [Aspergillus ruber CBS 135680]EYE95562.1 SET domain-containing protein [Aspergillus ruber CBS 135680]